MRENIFEPYKGYFTKNAELYSEYEDYCQGYEHYVACCHEDPGEEAFELLGQEIRDEMLSVLNTKSRNNSWVFVESEGKVEAQY